jgi:hypothetical protein
MYAIVEMHLEYTYVNNLNSAQGGSFEVILYNSITQGV